MWEKQLAQEGKTGPRHRVATSILDLDHEKKNAAKLPHRSDGLASVALVHAEVAAGVKTLATPELLKISTEGQQIAAAPTVSHKVPEVHLHIVDARKKHGDLGSDDHASSLKEPQSSAQQKDPSPAVAIRSSVPASENTGREGVRHAPVAQAPFTAALERLREMAGSELTRAASIILRDGGGEIKLTLKPESLGSVRVRMSFVDNAIEGRIIVDNSAVKHIFEGSLDSLTRALTAEGFQTASLQVSVGGQGGDGGRQDRETLPHIRRVEAAQTDWNVSTAESLGMGDLLVNLFV